MPVLPLTNPTLSSVSPPSAQHNPTSRARRFLKIITGIVFIVLLARSSYPILIFLVFLVLFLLFACRKPKNRNANNNRTLPGVNRVGTVSDGSGMNRRVVSPGSTIPPRSLTTASATIRPIPPMSPPHPVHPKQTRVRNLYRAGGSHRKENPTKKEEVVYPSKETLVRGKEHVSCDSAPEEAFSQEERRACLAVPDAAPR